LLHFCSGRVVPAAPAPRSLVRVMVRRAVSSRDSAAPSRKICVSCVLFLGTILGVQVSVLNGLLRRLAELRAIAPPDNAPAAKPLALGILPQSQASVAGMYDPGLRGAGSPPGTSATAIAAAAAAVSAASAGMSGQGHQAMGSPRQGRGLALGVAFGQGVDSSLTFLTSLLRVSGCSVVLFVDSEKLTTQLLAGVGIDPSRVRFEVRPATTLPEHWSGLDPANFRYWLYADYLERSGSMLQYAHIQLSDVRDVAFQTDPFTWAALQPQGVNVFEEEPGSRLGTDIWKKKYIHECYGDAVLTSVAQLQPLNSGYMIGTSQEVLKYAQRMVSEQLARQACLKRGYDQGIHNVVIRGAVESGITALEVPVYIHQNAKGPVWTGTRVPKGKPRLDGKNNLLTQDLRPYAVLHQYDENEELWQVLNDRLLAEKKKKIALKGPACSLFEIGPGDVKGFDLSHMPAADQDDCCIGCVGDMACWGFIYSPAHKHCWLKVEGAAAAANQANAGTVQTLYGRRK